MPIECVESQEWIEEEIEKPVEKWVEQSEEKCKRGKWYDPRRWICWLVTKLVKVIIWVVVKVGKWVVRTICKLVGGFIAAVRDILRGLWDIVAGIFTLNWRRILDGLLDILSTAVDFAFTVARIVLLGDTIDYIVSEIQRGQLKDHVRKLLNGKYNGEELEQIKRAIGLDYGTFGLRMKLRSIRCILDSEDQSPTAPSVPNLVVLHENGSINLRELCGFEFNEGFWNRKRYKTIKKGIVVGGGGGGEFDNPISEEELDVYLSSRGAGGPKFYILSMRDRVLKTKNRTTELKARELGLILAINNETVKVSAPQDIVHAGLSTNNSGSRLATFLVNLVGRTDKSIDDLGAAKELCQPVLIGVFKFPDETRGTSSCLRGSSCQTARNTSGGSFIDNKPDIVKKYIPIHELGHVFGLCHVDGLERVMYTNRGQSWLTGWVFPKLLYTKGEPSFTLSEAKQTWDYIIEHFPPGCLGVDTQGPIIL